MVRHAFSIDLPEEISGRCAGREPRLVEMEETERDSKLRVVYVTRRRNGIVSDVRDVAHNPYFFSISVLLPLEVLLPG